MITTDELKKIANLARIDIDDNDFDVLRQDMQKILDYVDKIKEVDTENVEPTWNVTGLTDQYRDDQPEEFVGADKIRSLFPNKQDDLLKTKKVL